ncbi:IclR family transcriptional regulator [Neobacillus sp. CF12]|uniref:IclR family transcriptional regulator n=1 Tax=Neobacillus sp. CF12 TaxID=3055864 RepID=UPI0025A213B5|nr:IclR family transcriptional regulator [Neobacillus sp. CF12]MDM5327614.1 IclR family transcriptional regulator [Neobacillus sp. CF12]
MEHKNQEDVYLSSVKNALRILKSFSMDEPEKKVSDISASLGLNKSTVSRTMATLASEGFVYKDPDTKKYCLGLSLLSLSSIVNSNTDVYRESYPVLSRLVDNLGETAHISVIDKLEVIYLQKVECNHPVRFLTHVGRRNPPHCTSSGKVLLAYADEELVDRVLERELEKYTKHTITDRDKFRTHLKEIRKNGYSTSFEELNEGVNSLAAPIYDYRGKVIAALSVVGPKQRIQSHKIQAFAKKIITAAMEVSERMGYRG